MGEVISIEDRLPRDALQEALELAYMMGADNALRGGRGEAEAKAERCIGLAHQVWEALSKA